MQESKERRREGRMGVFGGARLPNGPVLLATVPMACYRLVLNPAELAEPLVPDVPLPQIRHRTVTNMSEIPLGTKRALSRSRLGGRSGAARIHRHEFGAPAKANRRSGASPHQRSSPTNVLVLPTPSYCLRPFPRAISDLGGKSTEDK